MNLPNVKVSVWPCKNKGKIVATAKVMIGNAISIYPLRLIQGRQRMFLGMPQMLDRAGDYRDVFFPINGLITAQRITFGIFHRRRNSNLK